MDLPLQPDPTRKNKRINLEKSSKGARSCLEVGLNAGHSALLLLAANPKIKYLGVDIGTHAYTKPAAQILARHFGNRFEYIEGDSTNVLPKLVSQEKKFDFIHIDGGHTQTQCLTDLRNSVLLSASSASRILLDDVQAEPIKNAYEQLVNESKLESIQNNRDNSIENLLFKIKSVD